MKSRKRTAKSSHSCASLHKYIKFRFGGKTQRQLLQLEPSLIYIYWIQIRYTESMSTCVNLWHMSWGRRGRSSSSSSRQAASVAAKPSNIFYVLRIFRRQRQTLPGERDKCHTDRAYTNIKKESLGRGKVFLWGGRKEITTPQQNRTHISQTRHSLSLSHSLPHTHSPSLGKSKQTKMSSLRA